MANRTRNIFFVVSSVSSPNFHTFGVHIVPTTFATPNNSFIVFQFITTNWTGLFFFENLSVFYQRKATKIKKPIVFFGDVPPFDDFFNRLKTFFWFFLFQKFMMKSGLFFLFFVSDQIIYFTINQTILPNQGILIFQPENLQKYEELFVCQDETFKFWKKK